MAVFLLDGRMCPAAFLDGNPRRAVYWYKSTEGNNPVETRMSDSLVFVPDDNGDSWDATNCPHGANMVIIVPDDGQLADAAYMQNINDALVKAHDNQQKAIFGGAPTHGQPVEGTPPPTLHTDTRPLWQQLGFDSKAAWREAGSPQS